MSPTLRGIIITIAFVAALVVPAFAGLLKSQGAGMPAGHSCWELVTSSNAGALGAICPGGLF